MLDLHLSYRSHAGPNVAMTWWSNPGSSDHQLSGPMVMWWLWWSCIVMGGHGSDYFDPGWYDRGSRSSIGVHMSQGMSSACQEVWDGYVTAWFIRPFQKWKSSISISEDHWRRTCCRRGLAWYSKAVGRRMYDDWLWGEIWEFWSGWELCLNIRVSMGQRVEYDPMPKCCVIAPMPVSSLLSQPSLSFTPTSLKKGLFSTRNCCAIWKCC